MNDINLKQSMINLLINQYSTPNQDSNILNTQNFQSYFKTYDDSSFTYKKFFNQTSNNNEKLDFSSKTSLSTKLNRSNSNYNDYTSDYTTIQSKKTTINLQNNIVTPQNLNQDINDFTEEVYDEIKINTNLQENSFNEFIQNLKSEIDESLAVILMYDPNLVSQISEVLQVQVQDVLNSLYEMNLTISDLSNKDNLISFFQDIFQLESSEMLISIDNIKEQMNEIYNISTNVSYNEVFKTTYKNLTETLEQIQDLIPTPISNQTSKFEDISILINELNTNIVEVKNNTQVSQDSPNFFNQNFQQQLFNQQEDTTFFDFNADNFNIAFQSLDYPTDFNNISNISNKILTSQRNINSLDIINQIIDKMKNYIKTDTSEIKLLLRPDSLGEVSLKIITQNGIIAAQFTAENQKVKDIIESNFSLLKDMLNEKGIEVSKLEVSISDENSNSNSNSFEQFNFQQQKSNSKIQNYIEKISQEEQEEHTIQYIEDNQLFSSNVNYSA